MYFLNIWDLVLTPIYLIVLILIAKRQRDIGYPKGHPLRTYFLNGLYVKFAGAIFITLIYQYYYVGGDTFTFYNHGRIINTALNDSLITWFKLITHQSPDTNIELYPYTSQMEWYNDPSSYTVAVISAIFGLLNGTTVLPIALMFAYFSFTGIWAMYRTFTNLYPSLHKELAIAFLFIPSVFIWGSAIFKDTICMFSLGWLTYTSFAFFINKRFTTKNILLLSFSFYLIYIVKIYILLAFVPALAFWLLTTYSGKIRSAGLRFLVRTVFVAFCIVGFFIFTRYFTNELDRYSLDNISQTASTTRGWITYASGDEGSTYDLGEFDPSIGGMLKKFPQAIVVTLFRPFPWEAKKIIVLFSALEALAFIYFTLKAFSVNGPKNAITSIVKDSNQLFCFIFSIVFAFAVGISSYNFGALSRYKIPCLPFYTTMLIVLIYKKNNFAFLKPVKRTKNSISYSAM